MKADGGADCAAFLETLAALRQAAWDMDVHRLVWHIYNTLNVLGVFGAMDRGGERGRGESVWLTWFLALVLKQYPEYENIRRSCLDAAEHAWDGAWYRRGYYDDGTPLGSQGNDQCKIVRH